MPKGRKLHIYNSRNLFAIIGAVAAAIGAYIYNSRNLFAIIGTCSTSLKHRIYNSRNLFAIIGFRRVVPFAALIYNSRNLFAIIGVAECCCRCYLSTTVEICLPL